jgi:hypothetical protein
MHGRRKRGPVQGLTGMAVMARVAVMGAVFGDR